MEKFIQSLISQLLREKREAAQYAAGGGRWGYTPALAQRYIEAQKIGEAQGEREKEIQERKLAAERERTEMTEAGALERARLAEEGATGRTRMGEEGAFARTRLAEEGATGRTRLTEEGATKRTGMTLEGGLEQEHLRQQGAMDAARLGRGTPMDVWVNKAPEVMAELAKNEMLTPEDRERAMQMYWQQALASSGQGLDFTPAAGSRSTADIARDVDATLAGIQDTGARNPRRSLAVAPEATAAGATGASGALAAAGADATRRTPTRTKTPEMKTEPLAPRTDWFEPFPKTSGLRAIGEGIRDVGKAGALEKYPEDSLLGRIHRRYY